MCYVIIIRPNCHLYNAVVYKYMQRTGNVQLKNPELDQTTTTTTTVLWPFICDYLGEPVPEETFTHSHISRSSNIFYQLPPSSMIHSILPVQFTCLTVFFAQPLSKSSLVYFLVWNPSLHIPYISSSRFKGQSQHTHTADQNGVKKVHWKFLLLSHR